MTRNNFFKHLGAFAAVAVLCPLELLKGKEQDKVVAVYKHRPNNNGFNLQDVKAEANSIAVSDGYGNIEWRNPNEFYARQYPLTEEECFSTTEWKDIHHMTLPQAEKYFQLREKYNVPKGEYIFEIYKHLS